MDLKKVHIKENSFLARIAAWKMKSKAVAMVLGSTIHLHNISKEDFLKNTRLVKHELCHVQQYKEHGFIGFLIKYLWGCMRYGYYNCPFEKEARAAEDQSNNPEKLIINNY